MIIESALGVLVGGSVVAAIAKIKIDREVEKRYKLEIDISDLRRKASHAALQIPAPPVANVTLDPKDSLAWLYERQRDLQIAAFDGDPSTFDLKGKIQYIQWNILGATDELHEVLGEVEWKMWTGRPLVINEERYCDELADVLHLFLNLCLVVDLTPDELVARYWRKHQINRQRAGLPPVQNLGEPAAAVVADLPTEPIDLWPQDAVTRDALSGPADIRGDADTEVLPILAEILALKPEYAAYV